MLKTVHNGHVLGAAAFVAPALGLYAPRGLAALLIVTAIVAIVVHRVHCRAWPFRAHAPALILAATILWAAVSVAWTIIPPLQAASGIVRLVVLMGCGLALVEAAAALAPEERRIFGRLLVAGYAIALVLVAIDRAFDAPIRRLYSMSPALAANAVFENFNRGLTVLALLVFPAALVLWRQRKLAAIGLWAVTLALAFTLTSTAALVALILGAAVAACGFAAPRLICAAMAIMIAAAALAAPLAARHIPSAEEMPVGAIPWLPNSAHHRLMIWRFTAGRTYEKFFHGWGFDSSRSIPGKDVTVGVAEPSLPLHPHDAVLQWWLEFGAVGGVLAAALCAAIALAIGRLADRRGECAAAIGLYVAGLSIAEVSYGTWQGWWIAALWLGVAALFAARHRAESAGKVPESG